MHLHAVEAGALRHLAAEEVEVGPLRRAEVEAVHPGHADHEGLLGTLRPCRRGRRWRRNPARDTGTAVRGLLGRYEGLTVCRNALSDQARLTGDDLLRPAHLNPRSFDDAGLQPHCKVRRQTDRDTISQCQALNLALRAIDYRTHAAAMSCRCSSLYKRR